jgi:hypothetical protein
MSENNGHEENGKNGPRQRREVNLPEATNGKVRLKALPRSPRRLGKIGRPSLLTPEMIGKIEIAARGGASYSRIAQEVGIPSGTLSMWMDSFEGYHTESFREQVDLWRATPCTVARSKLMEAFIEGQPWAIKFFLENRDEDYGGRPVRSTSGTGLDGEEELETPGDPSFL